MRLTDRCQIIRSGSNLGPPRPCEFGHTGADTGLEGVHFRYKEQARVIVGPDAELASTPTATVLEVEHKDKTYAVTAILPRYRPGGRLHHVSLDLEAVAG